MIYDCCKHKRDKYQQTNGMAKSNRQRIPNIIPLYEAISSYEDIPNINNLPNIQYIKNQIQFTQISPQTNSHKQQYKIVRIETPPQTHYTHNHGEINTILYPGNMYANHI